MIRILLFAGILCSVCPVAGQVRNGSTLFIGENVPVLVEGSCISTGFFMNQGEFYLDGNWKNSGIYQGQGSIDLFNTSLRQFVHNGNPISNLRISGGGRIQQSGTVIISGKMDFEYGIWHTDSQDTLLLLASSQLTGGHDQSFVDGPLHRRGSGFELFPIGLGDQYLPVLLQDVTGASPLIRVVVHPNLPVISIADQSGQVVTDYYWEVDAYRDVFNGSPVSVALPGNSLDASRLGLLYGRTLTGEDFGFLPTILQPFGDLLRIDAQSSTASGFYVAAEHIDPVRDKAAFYFPNTLSPNAVDPENRCLILQGDLQADGFKLVVFNRVGTVIYETDNLASMQTTGWDGTSNGKPVAQGNYPYVIRTITQLGRKIEQKGMISVIR